MRAWYIREQRHILGTSDYAEVDLFETTDKEHTASARRKRELATSIAQHMIDFSSTVVELSGDSEKQKEVQDIAKCLRTLYSTPIGSQEGDRELGINPNIFVDKPLPVAKGLYVAEVTEKTASFEPRARVVRVDWLDSDVLHGVVIPKVVYELV